MKRGFAAMTTGRLAAIASAGGRAAHARGTAHRFTSIEAKAAAARSAAVRAERVRQRQEHNEDGDELHEDGGDAGGAV